MSNNLFDPISGTDSDSDLELPDLKKMKKKQKISQENEDVNDSDIASDDPEEDENDVRRWGTKKKHYYGGNTGEEIEAEMWNRIFGYRKVYHSTFFVRDQLNS